MNARRIALTLVAALGIALSFPIRSDTLENGLLMLTSEDHHLPMVQMGIGVRAGSAADPQGQDGLANLVARLLTRGTLTRSATVLNQEIEFVGGSMYASADADHTVIGVRVLAKDIDRALDLLTDMVLHPAFSDSEVNRARQEVRNEITRGEDDPWTVMSRTFSRDLFGNHPYGRPVNGYDSTVAELGRTQVQGFYETWFVPNNCYFGAVGDFPVESLKAGLERRLAGWNAKPVPKLAVPELVPISGLRGRVVNRPEMNQAYIILGHYGIRENAPDVFACRLMNFVLGGSVFSSKIGTAIREERGLAYDARSGFDRRLLGGSFTATTQTRTDSALTALNLLVKEMTEVRDKGITADELKRTRDYFLGNFPLQYESFWDRTSALDRIALFGLGLDYLDRYAAKVKAVTQEDVANAARSHLFPENYVLVVVGNLTEEHLKIPGIVWAK
jgi:zinc protease